MWIFVCFKKVNFRKDKWRTKLKKTCHNGEHFTTASLFKDSSSKT